MFRRFIRSLVNYLSRWIEPFPDELAMILVLHVSGMAIPRGKWVEFAPVKATCGVIRLSGNTIPCFEYTVFDKSIMEFIGVIVHVSRPDKFQFFCQIKPTDIKSQAKEVELKPQYQKPFYILAHHLFRYFPYARDGGVIKHELETDSIQDLGAIPAQPQVLQIQGKSTGS